MVQIRIESTANMSQATKQFAMLQARVEALNEQLALTSTIPIAGPQAIQNFKKLATATSMANNAFASTLAASDAFAVSNVRVADAVKTTTDALAKQKLSFREVFGKPNQALMKSVYRNQLALNDAQVRFNQGLVTSGKLQATLAVPTRVSKEWDTLSNRVGMFSTQLSSASRQLLNWGKNTQWAGRQLTVGLTVPMAMLGVGAGKLAYDIDKAFTEIAKVYDVSAEAQQNEAKRTEEVNALRVKSLANARQAAEDYGQSMTDTLNIEQSFAAAGYKDAKMFAATRETSRISFLGGIDADQAAEMNRTLMTVFRDQIKNTDDLHDKLNFLNAVSNSTSLSLQDIAEAVPRAATGFAQLGGTVEQMAVALVAMREAGVDAASGANALKSATTRIINPVAKATKFYEQFGIDLENIATQSGGNLFKYLQILGREQQKIQGPTEEQTKLLRAQGVAALFGTYQNNRLTAALTNMTDAYSGINNQTSAAIRLQGKSAKELEKIAKDTENVAKQQVSVQFRRQLETFKAELSELGKPFLQIATLILKSTSAFAHFFNSLPHGAKLLLAFGVGLGAIIGPTIMLVGLFANLAANAGLLVGWLGKTVTGWKITTENEWLAQMAAKAANSAFVQQADSLALTTERVNALNMALKEYVKTLSMTSRGVLGQDAVAVMDARARQLTAKSTMNQGEVFIGGIGGTSSAPSAATRAAVMSETDKTKRVQMLNAAAAKEREILHVQTAQSIAEREQAAQAEKNAAAQAKKAKYLQNGAGSAVLMGGAIAAMTLTSNETVHKFAALALTTALIAPALRVVGPLMMDAAKGATAFAGRTLASAKAITAANGGWRAIIPLIRAAGAGIAGILGPIGLITVGVGAIGLGLMAWYKHEQKINEQHRAQVKSITDSKDAVEETLDIQKEQLKTLQAIDTLTKNGKPMSVDDLAKEYKKNDSTKNAGDLFKDTGNEVLPENIFAGVLKSTGDMAQAEQAVKAFYVAAGKDISEATTAANHFKFVLGDTIDLAEQSNIWGKQFSLGMSVDDADAKSLAAVGKDVGAEMMDALARTTTSKKPEVIAAINSAIESPWNDMFNNVDEATKNYLDSIGITTTESFQTVMTALRAQAEGNDTLYEDLIKKAKAMGVNTDTMALDTLQLSANTGALSGQLTNVLSIQRSIGETLTNQLGLSFDINTLAPAYVQWLMKAQTVTDANKSALYSEGLQLERNRLIAEGILEPTENMNSEQMALVSNILNTAQAWNKTNDSAQGAKHTVDDLKSAIDSLTDKNISINVSVYGDVESMTKVWQSAASGATSALAESATNALSASADKRMSALSAAQERQSNALDAAQKRASDAADKHSKNAQKAIEALYDKRIDKVKALIDAEKKADETRQKLFEAEKTRIQRLADMQNKNIDFNTALQTGQLDEAAKIGNDIAATGASNTMDDQEAAAKEASDKRIEALEARQDRLEKMKDKALERVKAREEAEKASIQRVQDAQKASLKEQQEAQKAALQKQIDQEKAALAAKLELLKALPINNEQQLAAALKIAGLKISDFGAKTMPEVAKMWQGTFNSTVRTEAAKLQQDAMWAQLGQSSLQQILQGMGFASAAELAKFVKTGNLPEHFGNTPTPNTGLPNLNQGKKNRIENRHEGGLIGSGPGSRKGVARTQQGLGPGETWVRARKGEYMLNEKAASQYGPMAEAMNSGVFDPLNGKKEKVDRSIMGGPTGPAGIVAAVAARAAAAGMSGAVAKGIKKVMKKAAARAASAGYAGAFGTAKAGKYGDMSFSEEQLRNASTIASVGKGMGMSSRDIEIGIMTAITESGLRNVKYGDRDSLGLFQQRPSQGWGTPQQVTDPVYASKKFFSVLRNNKDRGDLSPWMAAQSVQRSAYSDGSNYRQYWNEAEAIFNALKSAGGGSSGTSGFVPGPGGRHRPVNSGRPGSIHDEYTGYPAVDIPLPVGTPIYAVADGTITRSYDLPGYEPRNRVQNGYRSYGKVMYLKTDAGPEVLYAHLSRRGLGAGKRVSGGSVIGATGNYGHSTGPHLHFGARGASPLSYMKYGGKTAGEGLAYLHDSETVLTKPLSQDLDSVVSTLGKAARRSSWNSPFTNSGMGSLNTGEIASGVVNNYTNNVNVYGSNLSAEEVADLVVKRQKEHEARKSGRR